MDVSDAKVVDVVEESPRRSFYSCEYVGVNINPCWVCTKEAHQVVTVCHSCGTVNPRLIKPNPALCRHVIITQ